MKYRLGKKQKRAILTEDGHTVVVFDKGKEDMAERVCKLLNEGQENNNNSQLDFKKIMGNIVSFFNKNKKNNKEMKNNLDEHIDLLMECKIQLEYLNEKFGETGTTNSLIAKIDLLLDKNDSVCPKCNFEPIINTEEESFCEMCNYKKLKK